MHADFPKLYREISTDDTQSALRWTGVETFVGSYTPTRVEMLTRLVFNTKPPAGGLQQDDLATELAAFHKAFSDADPSFEQGARQDQILAAAALIQYFATTSAAAQAVTTTACGGARKAPLPIDLVTAAENALSLLAANRRRRPDLGKVEMETPKLEYELDFSAAQITAPTTFQKLFDQLADAVDHALADVVAKFNASTKLLFDAGKKADEELDMLSWVFGQRAVDFHAELTRVFHRELTRVKLWFAVHAGVKFLPFSFRPFVAAALALKRKLSLPVSTMWQ